MEIAIAIMILIGVIVVAAVAFTVWLTIMIVKAIVRTVVTPFKKPKPPAIQRVTVKPPPQLQYVPVRHEDSDPARCPRGNCRQINPASAQFCRRCGMNLVAIKAYGPARVQRELVA
jgi:hypothetical protein